MNKPTILTVDGMTGPPHIGHYAGSLANRLRCQESHDHRPEGQASVANLVKDGRGFDRHPARPIG